MIVQQHLVVGDLFEDESLENTFVYYSPFQNREAIYVNLHEVVRDAIMNHLDELVDVSRFDVSPPSILYRGQLLQDRPEVIDQFG